MNDTLGEHYRKLPGLEKPWEVTSIELSIAPQRVEIDLVYERAASW